MTNPHNPVIAQNQSSKDSKEAKTFEEQVQILRNERGIVIQDELYSLRCLKAIGYHRLATYWYMFREKDETGKFKYNLPKDTISIENILELYDLDCKLRILTFNAIALIEVALRSSIVDQICCGKPQFYEKSDKKFVQPSGLEYLDAARFPNTNKHKDWLDIIRDKRLSKRRCINEYYSDRYSEQHVKDLAVPLWVVVETLDFADISHLYAGMHKTEQKNIAVSLGIDIPGFVRGKYENRYKDHPLKDWIHQLSVVRNICAHHGRLWNRLLWPDVPVDPLISVIPQLSHVPRKIQERSHKSRIQIFGSLLVVSRMLKAIDPTFHAKWSSEITEILTKFLNLKKLDGNPLIEKAWMGIPKNWNPGRDSICDCVFCTSSESCHS